MFDIDAMHFTIAQNGTAPALPGEAAPAGAQGNGTTTANGGANGQGGTAPPPGGGFDIMLVFILVIGVFVIISLFGSRKQKKQRETMLSGIKKHDTVQTIGGVIGSIVEVKNDSVVLKVDESSNTRITFSRSAIQQVLNSDTKSAPPDLEKTP